MARIAIRFVSGGGWRGAARAVGGALATLGLLLAIALLPGLLLGDSLDEAEAERIIRLHELVRQGERHRREFENARRSQRARLQAEQRERRRALEQREILSIDVDTSVFSSASIRRSFVVRVVSRESGRPPETRYYCFLSSYLTGECSRFRWYLAW